MYATPKLLGVNKKNSRTISILSCFALQYVGWPRLPLCLCTALSLMCLARELKGYFLHSFSALGMKKRNIKCTLHFLFLWIIYSKLSQVRLHRIHRDLQIRERHGSVMFISATTGIVRLSCGMPTSGGELF